MLEKDIEKKVCDYAKEMGFLVYKFSSPGHAAVPDRLFVMPGGRVFFIEFKAPGKKATTPQSREHARLIGQGADCYVVDGVDYGKRLIDFHLYANT